MGLHGVVISMNGTPARKARQGLDVGRLLQVVCIAIAEGEVVFIAEMMIQVDGSLIAMGVEGELAAIVFKLIH